MNQRQLQTIAWALSAFVGLIAIISWGQTLSWEFSNLSLYRLFPLFGLLAFSLMWVHYVVAALRKHFRVDKSAVNSYFEVTSYFVLVFILLHPGLLAFQLWRDGDGLPPGSYMGFVGSAFKIAIIAGMVSWAAFIGYEFRRKFNKKPWWKFVQYASDAAMLLIFVHALRLGGQLQDGWYRWIWMIYGISLAVILLYTYLPPKTKKV